MNPPRIPLTAPFRWLIDAVDVGRHQPQVVLGAIVATALIGLLPSLPQHLMAAFGTSPGAATIIALQGLGFVFGLLVMPALRAGVYRILDGAERGQSVRVGQIFTAFSDGSYGRLVALSALALLLYLAVAVAMLLVMALAVGLDNVQALQTWMERVVALQAEAGQGAPIAPAEMQALGVPPGLGAIFAVLFAFLPLWLFVALGSAWGLVSVALRGTAPIAALLGGLRAAVGNALPLLGMLLALALPVLLLALLVMVVLSAMLALFVSISPVLGGAIAGFAFLALGVVIAAITYGFVLNGWRATCDTGNAPATDRNEPVTGFEA